LKIGENLLVEEKKPGADSRRKSRRRRGLGGPEGEMDCSLTCTCRDTKKSFVAQKMC